jgi:hypothetical protein
LPAKAGGAGLTQRARIVLLAADGLINVDVRTGWGVAPDWVTH